MDLGDRRGGDRLVVECLEQAVDRLAELGFDRRPRERGSERLETVLQAREIGRHLLAQNIGAGREQLAEFDDDGTEVDQGGGKPFARAGRPPSRCRVKKRARNRMPAPGQRLR